MADQDNKDAKVLHLRNSSVRLDEHMARFNTDTTPCPDMINICEQLLEKAKSGELRALAGLGVCAGYKRLRIFVNVFDGDVYQMRGSLDWLKDEYVRLVEELTEDFG